MVEVVILLIICMSRVCVPNKVKHMNVNVFNLKLKQKHSTKKKLTLVSTDERKDTLK